MTALTDLLGVKWRSAHEFNTGPICIRCGISKGTADKEAAEDAARARAEAVGDE